MFQIIKPNKKYFIQLEKYVLHLLVAADPFLFINIKAGCRVLVNYYHLFINVTQQYKTNK